MAYWQKKVGFRGGGSDFEHPYIKNELLGHLNFRLRLRLFNVRTGRWPALRPTVSPQGATLGEKNEFRPTRTTLNPCDRPGTPASK